MKAELSALLCSAVLLSLGCYRSPMNKAEPRPSSGGRADAGLAVADATSGIPDLPSDPARESAREAGPDLRDLGAERGVEAGRDLGSDLRGGVCEPGENYILVLGADENLYRLYPDSLQLIRIGPASCGSAGHSLNSLTVSPSGPAYISNDDGELCRVDLDTFVATGTDFNATAVANQKFGMAMVPDDVPAGQTLYIAVPTGSNSNTLAQVDLTNYAITTVGEIVIRRDGSSEAPAWVELTAGSNGELYGFSLGATQSLLLTIDPRTAEAIDVSKVPAGALNASFALVDWHGTLYVFLGSANDTGGALVFTYRKGDAAVSNVGTLGVDILGAGVALCH